MVSNFGSKLTDKDNVCGLFLSGFDAMISQRNSQHPNPIREPPLVTVEQDSSVDFDTAMQMRFMNP